jgi:hypothetical protein
MLARRLKRQPRSVYYRRLTRIQQILRRMDQTNAVQKSLRRVAAAIQLVLVRDQGGCVDELDQQVRELIADVAPEVMAREMVAAELVSA